MQAEAGEGTHTDTRKGREEQRRRQQESQGASLKLSYILTQVSRDMGLAVEGGGR